MNAESFTLSELIEQHGGLIQTGPFGSQLHQHEYVDSGVPVVMPKDIAGGRVSDAGIAMISENKANALARHKLEKGDIVFPRRGDIRKCALIGEDQEGYLCGTGCLKITLPDQVYSPHFLYYYLVLPKVGEWLERNAVGTTMLNLNTSILGGVSIPDKSIDEQNEIVSILSAYDNLIENNRRRIQLLEESARLLYKEWFVRLRFPGHEHVKVVDGVPEGWEKKELGNISTLRAGGSFKRKYQGNDEGDLPFIKVRDMNGAENSVHITGADNWVTNDECYEFKGKPFPVGTVVFAKIGEALRKNRIRILSRDTLIDNNMMGALPKDKISTSFLYTLLSFYDFNSNASGAAVPFLSAKVLAAERFLIPKRPIRLQFDKVVSPILQQILSLQHQTVQAAQARDLLLPRLMNGEVAI